MKYIEGQKYIYKTKSDQNIEVIFAGTEKNYCWLECDNCKKEINNIYFFVVGDLENPSESYTFGSECVKKCISESKQN